MRMSNRSSSTVLVLAALAVALSHSNASAATNQFRGVNWADSRDNFQPGVLYVSGLSSSDTYASALATGTAVMAQFMSKLGANAVRMPINEATVSGYWSTYTGAIDAVLTKGSVVLCYWDSNKSNKPSDMNAFWSMWKTVVDKYGSNDNAYFEVFNEPNMYSKSDLASLYSSWLTQFSTVPKRRVILDGTGNAQNVSDVGSVSALEGCLLAVHDYSFFGSDTWTTESQWSSHLKGEVGNYADRTVCTEWGGPMSPGSKNGVSYGSLDYSKSPTNYFEAYVRGISSQLRTWNMGSFYWPGLRDGDWYSMTTRTGTGSGLTLSVSNQSGLAQLQNAWTGPAPSADAGAGGSGGRDGADGAFGGGGGAGGTGAGGFGGAGGTSGTSGTSGTTTGGAGSGGSTVAGASGGQGGRSGTGGAGAGGVPVVGGAQGSGGATAGVGGARSSGGAGGAQGSGGATAGVGGAGSGGATAGVGGTGGRAGQSGSNATGGTVIGATGGSNGSAAQNSSGCSCNLGSSTSTRRWTQSWTQPWIMAGLALALAAWRQRRRR